MKVDNNLNSCKGVYLCGRDQRGLKKSVFMIKFVIILLLCMP